MSELTRTLLAIVAVYERLALPYVVMGGIAVRAYGIPRPTYDVDFTLAVPRDRLPELYEAVTQLGFTVPEPYLQGWIDSVAALSLVKFRIYLNAAGPGEPSGVDVDVFLAETPFQREVMRRRKRWQVNGGEVWLVTPEDLILLKLIAHRPRDIADVLDVMFVQGTLDEGYLRQWSASLGIADRLDAVLKQRDAMG